MAANMAAKFLFHTRTKVGLKMITCTYRYCKNCNEEDEIGESRRAIEVVPNGWLWTDGS